MASRLRIYHEPTDTTSDQPQADVPVRLGELLPLIALAERQNYLWLRDFLDDEVRITRDLYEVLLAFQYRRPAS
ncbi:MAG: hypothetical protein KatS3mg105_1419 [Gemmatales bacterium]|nr:MAG: hypothetical protein KatS3mg105_1419 [Gemmatales bacterium]